MGFVRDIKIRGGVLSKGEPDPNNPPYTIVVPDVALFLLRGEPLQKLNYIEYLSCVQFENTPMPQNEMRANNPLTLKTPARYSLSPAFEGANDCRHSICLKQKTPLLTGRRPGHPGIQPESDNRKLMNQWTKKADAYAAYYLHLFMPLHSESGSKELGWQDLKDFIKKLEDDNSAISKFRLMMMHCHMQGLRTSEALRKLTLQHRARTRYHWTDEELMRFNRILQKKCLTNQDVQDMIDELTESLSSRQMKQVKKQLEHDTQQLHELNEVYSSLPSLSRNNKRKGRVSSRVLSAKNVSSLQVTFSDMQEWRRSDQMESDKKASVNNTLSLSKEAKVQAIRQTLVRNGGTNTQQLEIFDMYANFLLSASPRESEMPPKIVLLHGPPGVGKSKVRDANVKAVTACGRHNLLTAFNAINATEMGGVTVSYLTNLNSEIHANHVGTFKDSTLRHLRSQGYDKHSFNDIEECSNLAPWHLSRLSLLGCSTNNIFDKPFGDTYTRLSGDLTQLGPVKAGATLAQGVMEIYADSMVRKWMTNRECNKETAENHTSFCTKG